MKNSRNRPFLEDMVFNTRRERIVAVLFVYAGTAFGITSIFLGISQIEKWSLRKIIVENLHFSFGIEFIITGIGILLLVLGTYFGNQKIFSLVEFLCFMFVLFWFMLFFEEMTKVDSFMSTGSLVLWMVFTLSIDLLMIISALIRLLNVLVPSSRDRLTLAIAFWGVLISLMALFK
ncbi:hypothetical protein A6F53_00115 [Levilactobacillus brevis]|uniref:hypothetical protein n=1 Tax=Levilactobacillus brevis TaxID=1580 RepID=UPI0004676A22|nr:hypothetical protein [Levilactobacillus brevis]ANN47748.1 hypothetical protein A6F53_00115 [Levilactobacillus brevis]ATU70652.1 hypothetical protein CT113_10080 [Levilactobacillus brevis]